MKVFSDNISRQYSEFVLLTIDTCLFEHAWMSCYWEAVGNLHQDKQELSDTTEVMNPAVRT